MVHPLPKQVNTYFSFSNSFSLLSLFFRIDNSINEICRKYEIQPKMSKYLTRLLDYEIVIVCDDSDSMKSPIYDTERTRWDELCSMVKIIVDIGVIFDSNGVDLYFLNRPAFNKVKDPKTIEQAFTSPSSGHASLPSLLTRIFQSKLAQRGRDKKLLVFVATDADHEEHLPELERVMQEERQMETTFVSFLLCNDDQTSGQHLDRWDRTLMNVDVNENYRSEREKIRRCQQQKDYPFSYGDYVMKVLVGAIVPQIDLLNEPL